jgi:hypothetical protein
VGGEHISSVPTALLAGTVAAVPAGAEQHHVTFAQLPVGGLEVGDVGGGDRWAGARCGLSVQGGDVDDGGGPARGEQRQVGDADRSGRPGVRQPRVLGRDEVPWRVEMGAGVFVDD